MKGWGLKSSPYFKLMLLPHIHTLSKWMRRVPCGITNLLGMAENPSALLEFVSSFTRTDFCYEIDWVVVFFSSGKSCFNFCISASLFSLVGLMINLLQDPDTYVISSCEGFLITLFSLSLLRLCGIVFTNNLHNISEP